MNALRQIIPIKGFSLRSSIRYALQTLLAIIVSGMLLAACSGGGSDSGTSSTGGSGGNGCSAGYCNSNGSCCPSAYRYYCEGSCYASNTDAMSASAGRCTSFRTQC